MSRITGGTLPAQIWNDAMRAAHEGVEVHPLPGIEQPVHTRAKSKWRASSTRSRMRSATELGDIFSDDDSGDDN
ncbi:MAG: hypothetical protein WDM79_13195 [Terricaulis sp.]